MACRQCGKPAGVASTGRPFTYCFPCREAAATCKLCENKKVFGGRGACFDCSNRLTVQVCPQCGRETAREAWKNGPCTVCWKKNKRAEAVREMAEACFSAGAVTTHYLPAPQQNAEEAKEAANRVKRPDLAPLVGTTCDQCGATRCWGFRECVDCRVGRLPWGRCRCDTEGEVTVDCQCA